MSLHIRLLLLLIVCTSAFAVGATLWKRHEAEEIVMMQQDARRERAEFTGQILALKESGLATLVRDYTFWDEMARFAQKGSRTWAVQNIDTALPTYKAMGAWVYDIKGRLVYSTNTLNDKKLKSLPVPMSHFLPKLRQERFAHFFLRQPVGLIELRGATIHTTTDTHRTGRVFGYFFAARLWDKTYLKEVEELTTAHVQLLPPTRNANAVSIPEFTTRMEQTLTGWNGQPLALLCLISQHTTLRLLARSQKASAKQAFTYVLTLIGLLWICLLCWVSLPLRRVTYALQTETPDRLGNLPQTRGEFGHLARLVNSFFHQKAALEEAHGELQALHGELMQRNRELEEANAQLEALATTDGMTGMPNHRAFQERLRSELKTAVRAERPLSLLMIDVDKFKQYNDHFGHPAGDSALRIVANLLRENCRAGDFPARYGGEEFAVVLPNTDASMAMVVAERLRCLAEAHSFPHRQITLSIGLAWLEDGLDAQGIIANADRALYASKRDGRNRVTDFQALDWIEEQAKAA